MMRSICTGLCALGFAFSVPLLSGCGISNDHDEPSTSGTFRMPLTALAGEHLYRLSNVSLRVDPGSLGLYGGDNPNEQYLTATLASGSYTAELTSWTLQRAVGDGRFEPVAANLTSSPTVRFELLNGTTTTVEFQFETDGQIVTLGSGQLRISARVDEKQPTCTVLGDDCPEGSWCAPSELTGAAVACVPAGTRAVGESCASPLDCVHNSACYAFGASAATCAQLCQPTEFGKSCETGGICRPRGADYGVCEPDGSEIEDCPTPSGFLPITDRVDMAYDSKRCKLYVSTRGGALLAHDLRARTTEPLDLSVGEPSGGPLWGLDISPNRELLVVADGTYSSTQNWVHLIDLSQGAARDVRFNLGYSETGTYSAVFLDDQRVLVTSQLQGSGWQPMRLVDLASGSVALVGNVRQSTLLSAGVDRSVIAYIEPETWYFGVYQPSEGTIRSGYLGSYPTDSAASKNGSQVAISGSSGVQVYDRSLTRLATLGAGRPGLGVAYSPVGHVLYASYANSSNGIEAIDTTNFETLYTVDSNANLGWSGNTGFGEG
ncbi:MAG TPA: hypothetical protein VFQ61_26140, partial [Polyangiaceae bacterium]|nr:hypothetical protein [Polyangiaceae bacterium]